MENSRSSFVNPPLTMIDCWPDTVHSSDSHILNQHIGELHANCFVQVSPWLIRSLHQQHHWNDTKKAARTCSHGFQLLSCHTGSAAHQDTQRSTKGAAKMMVFTWKSTGLGVKMIIVLSHIHVCGMLHVGRPLTQRDRRLSSLTMANSWRASYHTPPPTAYCKQKVHQITSCHQTPSVNCSIPKGRTPQHENHSIGITAQVSLGEFPLAHPKPFL